MTDRKNFKGSPAAAHDVIGGPYLLGYFWVHYIMYCYLRIIPVSGVG